MSEGYQRRPEEKPRWHVYASVCWSLFNLLGVVIWMTLCCNAWQQNLVLRNDWSDVVRENGRLIETNERLKTELQWWTCRVQLEPMPVPEQVGEGPTLLPGEGK